MSIHRSSNHGGTPGRLTRRLASGLVGLLLAALLLLPSGCDRSRWANGGGPIPPTPPAGRLQEVAPPPAVQQLQAALADRDPRVAIELPADGATLPGGAWSLRVRVRDWPLVDAGPLGLGPHLAIQIDDQPVRRLSAHRATPAGAVVEMELPALSPGSHRITAYAARPWGESVKSPGASNRIRVQAVVGNPLVLPPRGTPELVPVSPADLSSSEPLLLDWLLYDAPLQHLREGDGSWRLRVSVNGDAFLVDENVPVWLRGWASGSNALRLELVDGRGDPLNPPFNSLVREVVLDGADRPRWLAGPLEPEELAVLLGEAAVAELAPAPPAAVEPGDTPPNAPSEVSPAAEAVAQEVDPVRDQDVEQPAAAQQEETAETTETEGTAETEETAETEGTAATADDVTAATDPAPTSSTEPPPLATATTTREAETGDQSLETAPSPPLAP